MSGADYVARMRKEIKQRAFWRDVCVELLATFFLMSVQAALPLSWNVGLGGVVQVALGMGFIVATMAWTLGDFGGGHMNPAVSIAFALRRDITVLRGMYWYVCNDNGPAGPRKDAFYRGYNCAPGRCLHLH